VPELLLNRLGMRSRIDEQSHGGMAKLMHSQISRLGRIVGIEITVEDGKAHSDLIRPWVKP
jgi:hypothetical protein